MKRLVLLGLSLLVAQLATAQQCTVLQYVGAPFTTVTTTGQNSTPVNGPLVGKITLAAPLTPNLVNAVVAVTAWDFSSEYMYLNSTDSPPSIVWDQPTFAFTTDSNGNIVNWQTTLKYFLGPGTLNRYNVAATSTNTGDSVNFDVNLTNSPTGPTTITGTSTTGGTWTCETAYTADYQAPVVTPPVDPLAAQVASLTAQVAALTTEVNSVIAERNTAESANNALTIQVNALTVQVAQVAPLTAKVASLTTQLASMTKTSASWNAKYVASQKALVVANATIAKLTAELNAPKLPSLVRLGR